MQAWEYRTIFVTVKLGFGSADTVMTDTSSGQQYKLQGASGGTKWIDELTKHLNRLGREGWELTGTYGMQPTSMGERVPEHFYVLKRPAEW